jgi:hypothetical protein
MSKEKMSKEKTEFVDVEVYKDCSGNCYIISESGEYIPLKYGKKAIKEVK